MTRLHQERDDECDDAQSGRNPEVPESDGASMIVRTQGNATQRRRLSPLGGTLMRASLRISKLVHHFGEDTPSDPFRPLPMGAVPVEGPPPNLDLSHLFAAREYF